MEYVEKGLDLRSVDIGCDGSLVQNQQKITTDFPALVERLIQRDWDTKLGNQEAITFPCIKDRTNEFLMKNYEFRTLDSPRVQYCVHDCIEENEYFCQSKSSRTKWR